MSLSEVVILLPARHGSKLTLRYCSSGYTAAWNEETWRAYVASTAINSFSKTSFLLRLHACTDLIGRCSVTSDCFLVVG